MQPLEPESEMWDKKKIVISAIALLVLTGVVMELRPLILKTLGKNSQISSVSFSTAVEGASTQSQNQDVPKVSVPDFSISRSKLQAGAEEKLNNIKQQVESINIQDIASSSPQVQKVINDLKSLENYPKNQAKQMCENICKNL